MTHATSPIIVFGAPRSGTTYLNAILNSHPDVSITHETRIFVWAHRVMGEVLDRPQAFNTYREEFRGFLRGELAEMIRRFYTNLSPDTHHWGDKNPHYAAPANIGALDFVRDSYELPRFVHIMRDGRDVVASLVRKRNPRGQAWVSFEGAHDVWTEHADAAAKWVAGNPHITHDIRYEDLVADDVGVARKVFDFLGIDFHPRVAAFCTQQSTERTPLSGPTRDLTSDNRSEWLEVVGPERAAQSLGLLANHLVTYGYETPDSIARLMADLG